MGTSLIKKLDILVLILLPLIAVMGSLALRANFLTSAFLFYGLPAIYLSWRNTHAIKRAFIFSLLAFPVGFVGDYLATNSNAWYVPQSSFPFRVLGVVPIDDLIWGFMLVYVVVIFYEHFLDKGKHNNVDRRLKYGVYITLASVVIFFSAYLLNPALLRIPYAYFTFGALAVFSPIVIFLSHFPRFLAKYTKVIIYFTCLNLVYEITALELGQWQFLGREYFGWVELWGHRFPFEEFFFYIVLISVAILSNFEYFDDGHLKREARRYT